MDTPMNLLCIILLASVFTLISCGTKAQNVSDLPANSFPFNLSGQTVKTFDNRYEGLNGSETFLEDFQPGTVELKNTFYKNVLINYDAFTDNLLAKHEKLEGAMQLRKDLVSSFTLKNSSGNEYFFIKRTIKGTPAFLLVIHQDSLSLYCRVSKIIRKANIGGAYSTQQINYDELITVNTYYFQHWKGELVEIQNSKRGILKAVPNYEAQLSYYLKGRKIDFNDYGQMKLLATCINEMIK